MHQYIPTLDNSAGTVGRASQSPARNVEPARTRQHNERDSHPANERCSACSRQYGNDLRAHRDYRAVAYQYGRLLRHQPVGRADARAAIIHANTGDRPSNANPDAPASNAHANSYAAAYCHATTNHPCDGHQHASSNANRDEYAYTNTYTVADSNALAHANRHPHRDADGCAERHRYRRIITHQPHYPIGREKNAVRAK